MQLFALYNCTGELNTDLRFYSLRVPLQIQREAGLITDVDAHWLDYMTQHFSSGAQLIDGFFHLRDENGTVHFVQSTNHLADTPGHIRIWCCSFDRSVSVSRDVELAVIRRLCLGSTLMFEHENVHWSRLFLLENDNSDMRPQRQAFSLEDPRFAQRFELQVCGLTRNSHTV